MLIDDDERGTRHSLEACHVTPDQRLSLVRAKRDVPLRALQQPCSPGRRTVDTKQRQRACTDSRTPVLKRVALVRQ